MDTNQPASLGDPLLGPRVLAWRSLMLTQVRVLAQIRDRLRPLGLSVSDFDVLVNIAPDEALRHTTLAERVVLSRTGLTRLVDRMCRRGLLERHEVEGDGRGVSITLTDKGRQVREQAITLNADAVHDAMRGLTDEEVSTLRYLTDSLGHHPTAPGHLEQPPNVMLVRPDPAATDPGRRGAARPSLGS